MRDYDPRYDMPPRIDRFMNSHPRITAVIIFIIIVGALALAGAVENA